MSGQTEEHRIRLLILDAFCLSRVSLSRLLAEAGIEVAAECGTPAEALDVLQRSEIDLVLLDFDVQTKGGDDLIAAARQAGYEGRFLLVAGSLDARRSALAVELGASGLFLKSESPDRLLRAIREIAHGEVWIDQKIIRLLAHELLGRTPALEADLVGTSLEERERQVLEGIAGGLSNRKIGQDMGISESSVKNIVQHLFSKAGVRTRTQLVRVALEISAGRKDVNGCVTDELTVRGTDRAIAPAPDRVAGLR